VSRTRVVLAVLFVAAVAGAAVAYSFLAPKRYEATARVVVHPLPQGDDTLTGVDVLRDTGDDARALETAASYFETPDVVQTTATRLGLSASEVEDDLDVHPLTGANVLLVVGKSSNRNVAAEIANGAMQEGISQRTARFQAQVGAALSKLEALSSPEAQRRVLNLKALQGRPDPTVEALSAATAPASAAWPKPAVVIPVATVAAVVLAALALLLPQAARAPRRRAEADEADTARIAAAEERERVLAAREAGLAQRQRDLERVLEETRAATTAGKEEVDGRAVALDSRSQELDAREEALDARERALAQREREVEEQAAEIDRAPALEPPAPEPAPAAPAPVEPGGWTIQALERLVEEHGNEHPDRVEEWRYYVHFLREHAGPEGALPSSFDALIDETFGDLL